MKLYLVFFLIIVTLISSCRIEPSTNNSINGIWECLGSGIFLEIKDSSHYAFYDVTSISCLPSRKNALSELQETMALNNDTLSLREGVLNYKFVRAEKLPKFCDLAVEESKANDPLYNFDVFSETVKEHYAYLGLNKINWDELYAEQRAKLNKESTDAELYLLIEETLEKLNDNHAFLEAPDEVYDAIDNLPSQEDGEESDIDEDLPEYGDFPVAAMVAKHHLQEELTEDSWLIQWGKLNSDIGYIQVKSMWLYADLDIPKQLIDENGFVDAFIETRHKLYEGEYIKKEIQGVRKIMDKVMTDLSAMESIIIDVRFNGGGQDAVSFEILKRFTPQRKQVVKQKFRYGDKFTAEEPIYVYGTENAFTKPVYILMSPQTGSAAEAFSIGAMSLSNIKRIGASTMGATSTTLDKKLPNGWVFSISNEIYMDNQGNSYENIGVPVNHQLDYPRDRQDFFRSVVNDLEKDKQNILNAIGMLEAN